MKSISMDCHGISRLYWVCKWRMGLRKDFRPLIHILEGENVWHQVMTPTHFAEWLAPSSSTDTSSGDFATGLKTTPSGMVSASFSVRTISWEWAATFLSVSGP